MTRKEEIIAAMLKVMAGDLERLGAVLALEEPARSVALNVLFSYGKMLDFPMKHVGQNKTRYFWAVDVDGEKPEVVIDTPVSGSVIESILYDLLATSLEKMRDTPVAFRDCDDPYSYMFSFMLDPVTKIDVFEHPETSEIVWFEIGTEKVVTSSDIVTAMKQALSL